tara:strand:- start:1165 stop:1362 length:198 start_codon:yes stop_codon:yes gene_type:complete
MPPRRRQLVVEIVRNQYIYLTTIPTVVTYNPEVGEEEVVVEEVVEDLGVVEEVEGLVKVVINGIT